MHSICTGNTEILAPSYNSLQAKQKHTIRKIIKENDNCAFSWLLAISIYQITLQVVILFLPETGHPLVPFEHSHFIPANGMNVISVHSC
jgi:hypothetical protein